MRVSRLTCYREVRCETVASQRRKSLISVSRESHETNVRLYEGKRPFFAHWFSLRFQRVFSERVSSLTSLRGMRRETVRPFLSFLSLGRNSQT
jgi:hypothetical protein